MNFNFFGWRSRELRVAIVAPNASLIIHRAHKGALRVLDDNFGLSYSTAFFVGNNNAAALTHRLKERLGRHQFDAIFSLGRSATRAAQEALAHHQNDTPIIFGGIVDPVGDGIVSSLERPGSNITGVSASKRDYVTQVKQFLKLGFKIKRMLIIQGPLEYKQNIVELSKASGLLGELGIVVKSTVITGHERVKDLLEKYQPSPDVIMLSHDDVIICFAEEIVEYCNRNKVVLFSSDEETVKLGAAVGYCDPERSMGQSLAEHALQVLYENKHPSKLLIRDMAWGGKFIFNAQACRLQGMSRIFRGVRT